MDKDYIAALCNYAKAKNIIYSRFVFVIKMLKIEAKVNNISIYEILDEYLDDKSNEYNVVECNKSVDKADSES